ncbi:MULTISPECIES: NAD-dependent epimerase/dehydratase family protein [Planococcus]|uniref:NAD(P)-dependent oxidoreductase n=1 Tax=Planococcus maitriensis TaxID=221799 RepID=A0A365KA57_9BACL|nr:NAD-dependent epimerase/dehydratase family protein [Planococcus maitriensis]RAZ69635.1 NAD(P)-dependent oxidoreductase [Planococcus maitriensis]
MILITGFTGNTGTLVLKKLSTIIDTNEIVGVSRTPVQDNAYNIKVFVGDLNNANSLNELFEKYPIKSIIHIANIRYSPSLLIKANEYGVEKVVLIHTTGVYSKYRSYSSLYERIEKEILNNTYPNTNFIILRPTMIYGNHRDHNMHKLIKFINRSPIFPVFGDGSALMQPVHVDDLATATVAAHQSDGLYNEDFDLSGGSVVTYNDVITAIRDGLGKKTKLIYIPIKLAIFGAEVSSRIMPKPIISVEQVKRLQEDKAYSNEKARNLLKYSPRTFNEGIIQEINLLREKGIVK